jgi:hypothetical protein
MKAALHDHWIDLISDLRQEREWRCHDNGQQTF